MKQKKIKIYSDYLKVINSFPHGADFDLYSDWVLNEKKLGTFDLYCEYLKLLTKGLSGKYSQYITYGDEWKKTKTKASHFSEVVEWVDKGKPLNFELYQKFLDSGMEDCNTFNNYYLEWTDGGRKGDFSLFVSWKDNYSSTGSYDDYLIYLDLDLDISFYEFINYYTEWKKDPKGLSFVDYKKWKSNFEKYGSASDYSKYLSLNPDMSFPDFVNYYDDWKVNGGELSFIQYKQWATKYDKKGNPKLFYEYINIIANGNPEDYDMFIYSKKSNKMRVFGEYATIKNRRSCNYSFKDYLHSLSISTNIPFPEYCECHQRWKKEGEGKGSLSDFVSWYWIYKEKGDFDTYLEFTKSGFTVLGYSKYITRYDWWKVNGKGTSYLEYWKSSTKFQWPESQEKKTATKTQQILADDN